MTGKTVNAIRRVGAVSLLLIMIGVSSLAQNAKRPKKPITKPTDISVQQADGDSYVTTKVFPGFNTPRQSIGVQAAFTTRYPDAIVLTVISVANDYQYTNRAIADVLIDGSSMFGNYFKPDRLTDSFNGLAVEKLILPMTERHLDAIASGKRVDIVLNTYTKFTLGLNVKLAFKRFLERIRPLAESSRLRISEEEDEIAKLAAEEKKEEEERRRKSEAEQKERNTCRLSYRSAPVLRGLTIGMSVRSLDAVLPLGSFGVDRRRLAVQNLAAENLPSIKQLVSRVLGHRQFLWDPEETQPFRNIGRTNISFGKSGCNIDTHQIELDSFGVRKFPSGVPESLNGIWKIRLLIGDARLIGYHVAYRPSKYLQDERGITKVGAFTKSLLENGIIPREWEDTSLAEFAACDGFYSHVDDYGAKITVVDTEAFDSAVRSCFPDLNRPEPTFKP